MCCGRSDERDLVLSKREGKRRQPIGVTKMRGLLKPMGPATNGGGDSHDPRPDLGWSGKSAKEKSNGRGGLRQKRQPVFGAV